uniref:Phospholipid transport system substrate-binding protein n=1 Tax=Candidatus Kentrum sp. LFY TaxID=2126342 RepID=A0A450UAA5_9GAMM|nr:MAG: phospholipid transport system substrate-binding protein [Candidatus Kentron sp. LFY]
MSDISISYRDGVRYPRFRAIEIAFRGTMNLYVGMVLLLFSLNQAYADSTSTAMEDSSGEAMEMVRETSKRLLESIGKEALNFDEDRKRLYDLVNAIVADKFDFRRMSSRVLGKNWRKATMEQKGQFIEQFKAYLVFTYAMALKEYNGQEIEYLPIQPRKPFSRTKVQTRIRLNGRPPIEIDYMLSRSREGTWKVIDVLVAGVSLVITYRSSFQAEIDRVGISGLIAKLKRNNDKVLLPNPS